MNWCMNCMPGDSMHRGQRTDDPSSPSGFAGAGRGQMEEAEIRDFGFKKQTEKPARLVTD